MIKLAEYITDYAELHDIREGETKLRLAKQFNVHFTTIYRWAKDDKTFVFEEKIVKVLN